MTLKHQSPIRVAIANRGEVAMRIIKACKELGLETVLLHSEADRNTSAYRWADHKVCIGPSPSAESYLNIERVISGALAGQAHLLHPGFGFLSENSDFVTACNQAQIKFVGPSAAAMSSLGDKVKCKKLASQLSVPLIPGYEGQDQSLATLQKKAHEIGYPVIVKAAAGGGGRGMKVINSAPEAQDAIESAQREAQAAFGNSKVFLEKYLVAAKHIEFQVFVDASGRVFVFGERECSVQRRHQKIIEEALSPALTEKLRKEMGHCASELVKAARYEGAATVEFLLEGEKFYLLEVNTRLQVEHPVTEMVAGVDLVKAQILTALKEPVFTHFAADSTDKIQSQNFHGHSIECRIYAEDPYQGGIPSTGTICGLYWPEGPGRRFECGLEVGDSVTSFYDSMIAKVIVWDETRTRAIQKARQVLSESVVFGVRTNIPLLMEILAHPDFVSGVMTTSFFSKYFSQNLKTQEIDPDVTKIFRQKAFTLDSDGSDSGGGSENYSRSGFGGPSERMVSGYRGLQPFSQGWRN